MKTLRLALLLVLFSVAAPSFSQVNFTITPNVICENGVITVSASIGTLTPISYSWSASGTSPVPVNPVVSSSTSQTTSITFPSPGVYNVSVFVATSNGTPSAINSVTVLTGPSISLSPSSSISLCPGFTGTLTAFGASTYTWTGASISPVVSQTLAVAPGVYTVTGFDNGCTGSTVATVSQAPPLTISVTQSSYTTCIESNAPMYSKLVHLTASGASSYVWFPQPPFMNTAQVDVRPAATTCYTVIGSTSTCSGSAVACVSVIPQFSAAITPSAPLICANSQASLSVTGIGTLAAGPASAFTYSWTESLNAIGSLSDYSGSTVTASPQVSTTYSVQVLDASGCLSNPAAITVSVTNCTGIDDYSSNTSFQLYPNPAADRITLLSKQKGSFSWQLTGIGGQVLKQGVRSTEKDEILVDDLPAGVYFVKIVAEDGTLKPIHFIKQ